MSMTSLKSPTKVLSPKNVAAERDHVRFYTLKRLKLGDSATEILANLHTVSGPTCVYRSTVFRWVEDFQKEQGPSSAGKVKVVVFQVGTNRTLPLTNV